MPRSYKTPGRRARDVARAKRSRAIEAGTKALRDSLHVSRRSKAWHRPNQRLAALRKLDARTQLELGRAGKGQRRTAGPRVDALPARPRLRERSPLVTKSKRKSGNALPRKSSPGSKTRRVVVTPRP